MKEVIVLSGKGGTGKTSIVASLAVLAKSKVLVDCDVDEVEIDVDCVRLVVTDVETLVLVEM